MCLVREEIQNTAYEVAFSRGLPPYEASTEATVTARGGVPRRAVAFLQVTLLLLLLLLSTRSLRHVAWCVHSVLGAIAT